MCSFGGGGGGFGGGGGGMGAGFASGFDSNFGVGSGLSFGGDGGDTVALGAEPITKSVDPNIKEGQKEFMGYKPGYDEKKLTALANKSGKSSLYVS